MNIETRPIIKTYAVQSASDDIRYTSTSGGTFFELASHIIRNSGVVCAAGFDESLLIEHKIISSVHDLYELQGSKYVQSYLGNCFRDLRQHLAEGKEVLFVGTPCQVAGLKSFLNNEYDNLYTVDLICFGVPSPKIYSMWTHEIETHFKKKIAQIYFRDKSYGYAAPNVKVVFTDGSFTEQNFIVKSYMKTFMNELNVRPACSECMFKGEDRVSDITMGDCWHVGEFNRNMDDNSGTTSVFIHTEKGEKLIRAVDSSLKIFEIETKREIALDGKKMISCVKMHPQSHLFFKDAGEMNYLSLVKKWVPDSPKEKMATYVKRILKNNELFKKAIKKVRS